MYVPIVQLRPIYVNPTIAIVFALLLNSGNSDNSDIKASIKKQLSKVKTVEIMIPVILFRLKI